MDRNIYRPFELEIYEACTANSYTYGYVVRKYAYKLSIARFYITPFPTLSPF